LRELESDLAHMNRLSVMGELAASLAHEVKQPIGSARNNARAALNFLEKRLPDLGEVKEALDCVVGDTDRAADIIDRIRDHIKKAPPRRDWFDLNNAIDEIIVLAHSVLGKNEVTVQTRLKEGLFPVQGDRVQVQQVLLNLVLNAIEAMGSVEAGARELVIGTEQSNTGSALVAVRIEECRDHGAAGVKFVGPRYHFHPGKEHRSEVEKKVFEELKGPPPTI